MWKVLQNEEAVNKRASRNAFLRGVPFIWCSNNLPISFAIQCYWYQQLTGDSRYEELMQAISTGFWMQPLGTSMVYGLPEKEISLWIHTQPLHG